MTTSNERLYDGRTLVEKLRKDAADYRWGHLSDAADEIERLREALSLIGDKCAVVLGSARNAAHQHVWDESLVYEKCKGCGAMRPARYTGGPPDETD